MEEWTVELEDWMGRQAIAVGFDEFGVAGVGGLDESEGALEAERFAAWVDAGRAGEMEYLKRRDEAGVLLRSRVQVAIPWARSVMVCAMNYNSAGPLSVAEAAAGTGWIARYAWSGKVDEGSEALVPTGLNPTSANPTGLIPTGLIPTDYHDELLGRLRRIEGELKSRVECETRCYVDTGPLVERTIAAQAGVGWIGKNTCVINEGLGSWLLLGVIVTSLPVAKERTAGIAADRCGSCTRCIDACPTGALVGPREMDAARCIAYLTIEKKGVIAEELRGKMGRQVFGCDICQDVCPWNRRAPVAEKEGMRARRELVNPALEWLAGMDAAEFKRWFKGSPVERTRRKRLLRNVAIAMGNSGEERFLAQLEIWKSGEDDVLAEAAGWAVEKIRNMHPM